MIRNRLPVVCLALAACAGPGQSVTAQQLQARLPNVASTNTPRVEERSCPPCKAQSCLQPAKQPPPAPQASSEYPIPGSGFYCAAFRKPSSSSDYQEICYRAAKTCNTLRRRAISNGYQVGLCETKDAAHCFTMVDEVEQKVHWRCYELPTHCTAAQEQHRAKYGVLTFSDCRLTAAVGGRGGLWVYIVEILARIDLTRSRARAPRPG